MNGAVLGSVAFAAAAALATAQAESLVRGRRERHRVRAQAGLVPGAAATGSAARTRRRLVPHPLRARRRRRRDERLTSQLAPALALVVGHLRIGRTIGAALGEVVDLVDEPLRSVLTETVEESRLGVPVDGVLQRLAADEGNRHLAVVASAIGLQRRHGGSLVEILEAVGETIEEEDRLRRDVRTLTADNRISARVLLGLPPAMAVVISLLNPGYAAPLVTDPLGRRMSIAGAVLAVVGWRWLRRLGDPEVVA
ncbi:MAG: hypothetical protein RL283_224 [Actinomycetota bacterium]|jgi:tight adherence protein B